jgi:class 3 adenylate cyclase
MSNAAPEQIMISRMTVDELGGQFKMTALPPLKVKGKAEPIEAFSVDWKKRAAKA